MMSTETQCSPEAEGSTNCGQMRGQNCGQPVRQPGMKPKGTSLGGRPSERGKKSVHRRPPPLTSSHQRGEWAYAVSAPLPAPWALRPAGLRGALPPTPEATTLAWITKTKARQVSPT